MRFKISLNCFVLSVFLLFSVSNAEHVQVIELEDSNPEFALRIDSETSNVSFNYTFKIAYGLSEDYGLSLAVVKMNCKGDMNLLNIFMDNFDETSSSLSVCHDYNYDQPSKHHLIKINHDAKIFTVQRKFDEVDVSNFEAKIVVTLFKKVKKCSHCRDFGKGWFCCNNGRDCAHHGSKESYFRCIPKSLTCIEDFSDPRFYGNPSCGANCPYDESICFGCIENYPENCYWFVWSGMFILVLLTLLPALILVIFLFWCRNRRIAYERQRQRREIVERIVTRSPPNDIPPNYAAAINNSTLFEKPPSFSTALEMEMMTKKNLSETPSINTNTNDNMIVHRST